MKKKRTIAIGMLGTVLDRGKNADRWESWRPTVALCQHEDLVIHRLELLYQKQYGKLAEGVIADIRSASPETEVRSHFLELKDPWDFGEVYAELYDFARKFPFVPDREDYLVHITTGTHVAQICMFLLTESRHFPAKLIQTAPPKKAATSSPGAYTIIDLDLSKYDQILQRFRQEECDDICVLKSGIATRNKEYNELITQLENVATLSREPVLLMGKTGAGKSLLARKIYEIKKSRRQLEGPFVEVNCATLRGDSAMSALFGHKKGSFTGAIQDRQGLLRVADGGMLFLDEVGELGPDEQAMLLRAIEEKMFLPVGADEEVESRFQLICGTNRDLHREIGTGRFREDLLARINLWTFRLPGLKDRPEDIEPNIQFELDRLAERTGSRVVFTRESLGRFVGFATGPEAKWMGNFRDLNGAILRMATLSPDGRITPKQVDDEIQRLKLTWGAEGSRKEPALVERILGRDTAATLDRFDRVQLEEVLSVCRESSSLSAAGRMLFDVSRERKKTANDADRLRKYLQRFGLTWEEARAV